MKQDLTIRELQQYIKKTDNDPNNKHHYFYKLIEETGELSEVIRKNRRLVDSGNIKETINKVKWNK